MRDEDTVTCKRFYHGLDKEYENEVELCYILRSSQLCAGATSLKNWCSYKEDNFQAWRTFVVWNV